MSVIDFGERKWELRDDPAQFDPLEALAAAAREVGQGEARHIIVCVSRKTDNGGVQTRYFQAGDYDAAGQVGLLALVSVELTRS